MESGWDEADVCAARRKGREGRVVVRRYNDGREEGAGQRGEAGVARSGCEQGEERAGEGAADAVSRSGLCVGSGLEAFDLRFAGAAVAVRPGIGDGCAVYFGGGPEWRPEVFAGRKPPGVYAET